MSNQDQGFIQHLLDLMPAPTVAKRMFGGYGVFRDDKMFALVADSVLYLKADEESEATFLQHGLERFTYLKKGKPFSMKYYQAPDIVFEDTEAMRDWTEMAYSAALRAKAKG